MTLVFFAAPMGAPIQHCRKSGRIPIGCVPGLAFALVLIASVSVRAKSFTWEPDSAGRTQIELYLDPYYSAVNYAYPLTSDPIRKYDADGERSLYWDLLCALPFPRDVLIEASVNPGPLAGVGIREYVPSLYRGLEVGDVKLVQAATADYPDPWALSLFFGNVAKLSSPVDSGRVSGIGYSGVLASFGNRHIVNNQMVRDRWLELEMKLKGEDIRPSRTLIWSFRSGVKLHGNDGIRDAWTLAVKRSRTDFKESGWLLLRNSSAEFSLNVDRKELNLLRYQLVVGKKFPIMGGKLALTCDLGFIRQVTAGYRGKMADYQPSDWKLVLRPNIEF
jgi:hypothetical protein